MWRGCLVFVLLLFLVPVALCLSFVGNSTDKSIGGVIFLVCAGLAAWAFAGGSKEPPNRPDIPPPRTPAPPAVPKERDDDHHA
jgi:hypothetical protein